MSVKALVCPACSSKISIETAVAEAGDLLLCRGCAVVFEYLGGTRIEFRTISAIRQKYGEEGARVVVSMQRSIMIKEGLVP